MVKYESLISQSSNNPTSHPHPIHKRLLPMSNPTPSLLAILEPYKKKCGGGFWQCLLEISGVLLLSVRGEEREVLGLVLGG